MNAFYTAFIERHGWLKATGLLSIGWLATAVIVLFVVLAH